MTECDSTIIPFTASICILIWVGIALTMTKYAFYWRKRALRSEDSEALMNRVIDNWTRRAVLAEKERDRLNRRLREVPE